MAIAGENQKMPSVENAIAALRTKMATVPVTVLDKEAIDRLAELLSNSLRSKLTDVKEELGNNIRSELTDVKQELGKDIDNKLSDVKQALRGDIHNELGKVVNLWAKTHSTQTPTELGAHVKEWASPNAPCAPQIVSPQLAEQVWGSPQWNILEESESKVSEVVFRTMLNDVNESVCCNVMTFTGNAQEDGKSLRKLIDFTIHIRGKAPLPCYTTGLLSLHSLPEPGKQGNLDRKYNGKHHVGHAISRAISTMEDAGPTRRRILVGVTNLRKIQWFTVERSSEDQHHYRLFTYAKSAEICEVRQSLVAVLMAKPADLFVCGQLKLTLCGEDLIISSYLGSGATSSVYKCDYGGKSVAAKIYRADISMPRMELAVREKDLLQQLEGVIGIPSCAGVADDCSFLAIVPIGKRIGLSVPKEARKHLPEVVDTLKAVHSKGIVHRDVRLGNMVLLDGLSFLLIDWGFACGTGRSLTFHGSLLTASKQVLKQAIQDRSSVLFRPEDDLISYVKSLYLLSQPTFDRRLRNVKLARAEGQAASQMMTVLDLWEEELKGCNDWGKAISLAGKRDYRNLRGWIMKWALNSCPYCEDTV